MHYSVIAWREQRAANKFIIKFTVLVCINKFEHNFLTYQFYGTLRSFTITIALLTQWPLLQLIIISLVHIVVICLSLTPKLLRKKTEKNLALTTEIGTLLFCWILVWIHLLDSEALSAKKILSWVAIALALILMISGILSKVAEVYIQWEKKKEISCMC